ncbi:uncharacterized protein LOC135834506 isoform X2 [Planococcus citri]|uniref:uncharacterized protein LOC135834506 isoform X2 n=1 Tax=Planococcus citri TaxID=170843 RepID=UPI0031F9D07D
MKVVFSIKYLRINSSKYSAIFTLILVLLICVSFFVCFIMLYFSNRELSQFHAMSYHKTGQLLQYPTKNQSRSKVYHANNSLSGSETDICSSNENLSQEDRFVICNTLRQEPQGQENNRYSTDSSYNTLIIHGANDEHRYSSGTPPYAYSVKHNSSICSNSGSKDSYRTYDPGVCEITNIPDDYLSQSQVLKHLAKEVKVPYSDHRNYENPNECSTINENSEWNAENNSLNHSYRSKSQPDLTRLHKTKIENPSRHTFGNTRKDQRCIRMMENLIQENNNLKLELEACYQNVAKSTKLEQEVGKVHRAHEDLVESCERRERLERTARAKLQAEIRRLQDANRSLRDQVDTQAKQLIAARISHSGSLDKQDSSKRDAIIAQLLAQNKELMATKDRQEIELSAQRVTLEEQRTHIDILDTALTNAQANVVRLEEECRKKQMHVDRVAQLQRALSSLQLTSERREQTERKLRLQLENELKMERARNSKTSQSHSGEFGESLPELKRKLREKDEKIMHLEGEVAKWEQRYLDESELRQAAIHAASIPKDAKIAALEKTSQESEKIIAEARSDKLRQMDEVHAAQKKVTDLESRMKELESKLAERDAMIKVLQKKHTYDKEVTSSSYPSMSINHHGLHSSLNMTDLNAEDLGGPASTTSVLSAASSVLTSSTGFGSNTSYGGSVTSSLHQRSNKYSSSNQSFDEKSLDDQLKELDSQLLSKRGLCCFPGFSHPGAVSRKGKASQPLLASVTGNNMQLFEPGTILQGLISQSTNRPDDMILLEKQGLCSQAQRQDLVRGGSLPPSSLPRPKKHRKSSVTTKFGEYGRLSDSEITMQKSTHSSVDNVNSGPSRSSKASRESTPKKLGEYSRLSDERKTPTPTSTPPNEKLIMQRDSRESSIPLPRRFGEYRKLADNEKPSTLASMTAGDTSDGCHSIRESPSRRYPSPGATSYDPYPNMPAHDPRKTCESPVNHKPRESPGRSMFIKWGEYNKLKIAENERKMSTNSTSSTESGMKIRSSPMRSLIPSVKKSGEYSCFTPASVAQAQAQAQAQADHKIGPNIESKLRIFSPGGVPGRRGSLQRENKKEVTEGVRSLPTPNKYRIHF